MHTCVDDELKKDTTMPDDEKKKTLVRATRAFKPLSTAVFQPH